MDRRCPGGDQWPWISSTILLARLLVPADFGLVALATSILAIVNAMTALPVSEALIQHRQPTTDHFHTAWSIGVARAVLIALVMAAGAKPAALIYSEPRLEPVMYAFALSVALGGFGNPRRIMLNRDLVFWQDALLSVGQKLAMILVSLFIAWEYRSYWALVLGVLAGQVAYLFLSYTALPFLPRLTFRHTRDLLSFSIWLSLGQIVNTINWRFDQLLIGGLWSRRPRLLFSRRQLGAVADTRGRRSAHPAALSGLQQGCRRSRAT